MITQLNQLILSNIRNLAETDLKFGSQFNVFIGSNGSGKTSFLEAIHLLSVGRSFRARSMQQVVAFGADKCVIRAQVNASSDLDDSNVWLGAVRGISGSAQYKIGEQTEKSASELSKKLPVQLIDVNSSMLLDGGPVFRRQFMDWGVFHVEHSFLDNWRLMSRALEQRNASLKSKQIPGRAWDDAFVKYANAVDVARRSYLERYCTIFACMLRELLNLSNVEIRYMRGWSNDRELAEVLRSSINFDVSCGYTCRGPQRADLEVLIDSRPAKHVLSRGQMKIFVCIMLLARAKLLKGSRSSVFLVDDLHAELDKESCELFVAALKSLNCQAFITGIEADLLKSSLRECDTQMFHVEQGCIR